MRGLVGAGAAVLVGVGAGVAAVQAADAHADFAPKWPQVTVSAVPDRICHDPRQPSYLNFDLHIRNGTERNLRIGELRGTVLADDGAVIERRLVWQQAAFTSLLPTRQVAAGAEGLLYNPLHFDGVGVGSRIRYELIFEDNAVPPASVEIVPESCETEARLILPLTGRVLVHDGSDFLSHHRQTNFTEPGYRRLGLTDNFQRFGIDLVHIDEQANLFSGDSTRIESWYSWAQPVRAGGGGTVVAIHNDQPDNDILTENRWTQRDMAIDEMTSYGNYVLIDHGTGEFSLLSHLRQGSVTVRPGDQVEADDIIAEVGNSGSSPVPHVHYELRTGWGIVGIRTLPAYFHEVTLLGSERAASGRSVPLNTGDVVLSR